ncbi:class I SAM-dependent methyltransferase [Derxia lacustris]|uniref:spermidine synthase n=1 Tax=Derxia lacustris TaxID=764842 RepID=UPI00111C62DF|nr:spermidine synthase [Derxia lacustris]
MTRRSQPFRPQGITLSEERGVRFLHFGTEWIQGAMRISRPWEIELEYVRQMMSWLLFLDPARAGFSVLQLGLGAAALTKFCWARFPCAVTAVERDPEVIGVARSMFALPPDDARLSVLEDGAAEFVARQAERAASRAGARHDVVQIDLYDAQARGPVEDSVAFYAGCRALLKDAGIVVVNLFGEHESFPRNRRRLLEVFDGRVLCLPEIDAGNRVALCFSGPAIDIPLAELHARAKVVEAETGLRARRWATGLCAALDEAGRGTAGGRFAV